MVNNEASITWDDDFEPPPYTGQPIQGKEIEINLKFEPLIALANQKVEFKIKIVLPDELSILGGERTVSFKKWDTQVDFEKLEILVTPVEWTLE